MMLVLLPPLLLMPLSLWESDTLPSPPFSVSPERGCAACCVPGVSAGNWASTSTTSSSPPPPAHRPVMRILVVGPCVLGGVLPLLSLSCIQDNLWGPPQMKQISIRISASLRHVNFAMVGQPARCDSQTILRGFQRFFSQHQFRAAPLIISLG